MDRQEYLSRVKSHIKTPTPDIEQELEKFCEACSYVAGQYDQDEPFQELDRQLKEIEKDRQEGHRIFYMALPPSVFITVSQHIKRNCYPKSGIARVIVRCQVSPNFASADINRSRNRSARIWKAHEIFRAH